MANTYTQIYMHIIFAVKDRISLIRPEYETELYSYICGACKNRKHYVKAINGTADHIHILISMHPSDSPSDLVQSIKIQSTKWMHEHFGVANFSWQSGFGAFSYSKSFLPAVERYIGNQKEHHKHVSLEDEMKEIFKAAGVDYKDEYILKNVE